METKYNTLNILENELTQYVLREIKFYEEKKYKSPDIKKRKIISNIYDTITKYDKDELIKNVIDIICEEGNLTIQEIIEEFNECNKNFYVADEYKLYEHIKEYISLRFLLTNPVNTLFVWFRTKRGPIFYSNLNKKVMKRLKLNSLFKDYINKIK